jgi:hypothetical protein
MDSPRSESSRAISAASEPDRDAKIEQLLLAGLDHYFAAQYEHAITVWTRVLFLDRTHARARAYIERARSAQAERQRELEERAATQSAAADVLRPDVALAGERTRLDRATPRVEPSARSKVRGTSASIAAAVVLMLAGFAAINRWAPQQWAAWRGVLQTGPRTALPVARDALIVPRRAELSLERARSLTAEGHLRDALTILETVRPTDPERAEADRLRADIQRQLLALTAVPSAPDGHDDPPGAGDRRPQ